MEKLHNYNMVNTVFDSPRVKFFYSYSYDYLDSALESIEEEMNEWLEEREEQIQVLDIKYTTVNDSDNDGSISGVSACIYYKLV